MTRQVLMLTRQVLMLTRQVLMLTRQVLRLTRQVLRRRPFGTTLNRRRRVGRSGRRTARTARKARKALAAGLLAFLTATLALSLAIEYHWPQWRDPEFGHRMTRLTRAVRENPSRPLILAIGTSRLQNALFPAAMGFPEAPGSPRVFNFGQSASPPLKELLTYRRVREAGIRPAAVLVEVLPATLAIDGPAEELLAQQTARLSAADLRHLAGYAADPGRLRRGWLTARLLPWQAQRLALMSHWLPRWLPWQARLDGTWDNMDADGFQPIPMPKPELRRTATELAFRQYRHAFDAYQPGESSFRAIGELVHACRADGIPLAFLLPPLSPAFRGAFLPGVYENGEAHLRRFADRLGVPVLPAPDDLHEDDFMDGHHMLSHGAERYSRWLADTHLKPWLATCLRRP